jgi:hypothetical protein
MRLGGVYFLCIGHGSPCFVVHVALFNSYCAESADGIHILRELQVLHVVVRG